MRGVGRPCPPSAPSSRALTACLARAVQVTRLGVQPTVFDAAPSALLGKFSQWIGTAAPAHLGRVALWHLLTAAFPPPGIVGIAALGAACSPGARPLTYRDTGQPAPRGFFPRESATGP